MMAASVTPSTSITAPSNSRSFDRGIWHVGMLLPPMLFLISLVREIFPVEGGGGLLRSLHCPRFNNLRSSSHPLIVHSFQAQFVHSYCSPQLITTGSGCSYAGEGEKSTLLCPYLSRVVFPKFMFRRCCSGSELSSTSRCFVICN
jgi:hypothetical protein